MAYNAVNSYCREHQSCRDQSGESWYSSLIIPGKNRREVVGRKETGLRLVLFYDVPTTIAGKICKKSVAKAWAFLKHHYRGGEQHRLCRLKRNGRVSHPIGCWIFAHGKSGAARIPGCWKQKVRGRRALKDDAVTVPRIRARWTTAAVGRRPFSSRKTGRRGKPKVALCPAFCRLGVNEFSPPRSGCAGVLSRAFIPDSTPNRATSSCRDEGADRKMR